LEEERKEGPASRVYKLQAHNFWWFVMNGIGQILGFSASHHSTLILGILVVYVSPFLALLYCLGG